MPKGRKKENGKNNKKEEKNQPKITEFFKQSRTSPQTVMDVESESKRGRPVLRGRRNRRREGEGNPPGIVLDEITLDSDDSDDSGCTMRRENALIPERRKSEEVKNSTITSSTSGVVDLCSPNRAPNMKKSLVVSETETGISSEDEDNSENPQILNDSTQPISANSTSEQPTSAGLIPPQATPAQSTSPQSPSVHPTVFAVFDTYEEAAKLAHTLNKTYCESIAMEQAEDLDPEPFDDDANDALSNVDLDKINESAAVSPYPNSTPVKLIGLSPSSSSPSLLEYSTSPNRMSPKAKVTHLSPVRHARKSPKKNLFKLPFPAPPRAQQAQSPQAAAANTPVQHILSPRSTICPERKEIELMENFLEILKSVMSGSEFNLFTASEASLCQDFQKLSKGAMCLYLRLYQRSLVWYRQSKITYTSIAEDLAPLFTELHKSGFLSELKGEPVFPSLETMLKFLDKEEMKLLGKDMNLNCAAHNRKGTLMTELLKMTKTQRTLSKTDLSLVLTKKLLHRLGSTFKVSDKSRSVFSRVFVLYSLPRYWEDETQLGPNHLLTMQNVRQAKMDFPIYRISKSRKIYRDHDDLVRFCEGIALHSQIQASIEAKDWAAVSSILQNVLNKLSSSITPETIEHDENLPAFLRIYTAGSVLTRAAWLGVEAYQKLKRFEEANKVVRLLLTQHSKIYLTHYRGRWHERFILNTKHLKSTLEELKNAVIQALSDRFVLESHRLNFTSRLRGIQQQERKAKAASKKKRRRRVIDSDEEDFDNSSTTAEAEPMEEDLNDDEEIRLAYPDFRIFESSRPISEIIVEAEQLRLAGDGERVYGKSSFLGRGGSTQSISSVEERALSIYAERGYHWGVHAEGSVPVTIFGLLFWDIIYMDQDVTDVFRCQFQPFPLDLHFDEFYMHREQLIQQRLHQLRSTWCLNDAFQIMKDNWTNNRNKLSVVNWNVFNSFDQVQSLVKSMGLALVANITERLASNYRHYNSGFPDLVVWNDKECVFVEVKGPGDKLSPKQVVWLDYLMSIDAKAEVCRVNSVSNKRIRLEN